MAARFLRRLVIQKSGVSWEQPSTLRWNSLFVARLRFRWIGVKGKSVRKRERRPKGKEYGEDVSLAGGVSAVDAACTTTCTDEAGGATAWTNVGKGAQVEVQLVALHINHVVAGFHGSCCNSSVGF